MTLATHPVLRPVMAGLLLGSSAALFSTAGLAQQAAQPVGSTLNLKYADIGTLITTVGEITGQNFIVYPRVKGQVTVISTMPSVAALVTDVSISPSGSSWAARVLQ